MSFMYFKMSNLLGNFVSENVEYFLFGIRTAIFKTITGVYLLNKSFEANLFSMLVALQHICTVCIVRKYYLHHVYPTSSSVNISTQLLDYIHTKSYHICILCLQANVEYFLFGVRMAFFNITTGIHLLNEGI